MVTPHNHKRWKCGGALKRRGTRKLKIIDKFPSSYFSRHSRRDHDRPPQLSTVPLDFSWPVDYENQPPVVISLHLVIYFLTVL